MKLSDFDYHLPQERIALYPVPERDRSRLFVLHRSGEKAEHRLFRDITEYLLPGDVLVLNDTKVIPARLLGVKPSGGKVQILLLKELRGSTWQALVKGIKRGKVLLQEGMTAQVTGSGGMAEVTFEGPLCEGRKGCDIHDMLGKIGVAPLPPYIRRNAEAEDADRYQTVYAESRGAVAAPTAGLHFSEDLLERILEKGVETARITLHVGYGTFQPVSVPDIRDHRMTEECYEISEPAALIINKAKSQGRRIIAVGTTVTRALEASALGKGQGGVRTGEARTSIFIYPGFRFRMVDALITNFHLPRSTPLMLASAFSDLRLLKEAYGKAIDLSYRFFSYGDAMLIL